jgi:hypothetical protein
MPRILRFLLGLAAVLLMGWTYHGPLGHGEALVDNLEAQARQAVAQGGVPGVEVHLGHHPLSRVATLSGTADDFQREGMGSLPGLNDRVRAVEGISRVEWSDSAASRQQGNRIMPLLLETLIALVIAYLAGVAIGWLIFGRAKKESYL